MGCPVSGERDIQKDSIKGRLGSAQVVERKSAKSHCVQGGLFVPEFLPRSQRLAERNLPGAPNVDTGNRNT